MNKEKSNQNILSNLANKCLNLLPVFYFVLTFIFFIFFNIHYNQWVSSGEMWAEMATNYYKITQEGSLFKKLFGPDYGYIPLLQRWIAFIISLFDFPSKYIPYLYTWSSLIITAFLVGSFCLKYFRNLLESDVARFSVSVFVLTIINWEMLTFINFTYINVFFVAIFIASALRQGGGSAPKIAYLIPILIVNKVYLFSLFPVLFYAVFFTKGEYKKIFIVSLFFLSIHFIYVLNSYFNEGFLLNVKLSDDYTFISKLGSVFYFFLTYNLVNFLGFDVYQLLENTLSFDLILFLSIVLFSIPLITLIRHKKNTSPLIMIGLFLCIGTFFLNSFINTPSFNIFSPKVSMNLYRHVITGFIGFLFMFMGVFQSWCSNSNYIYVRKYCFLFGFFIWIYYAGWVGIGISNSKPGFITSKWQLNSDLIDDAINKRPCVPIDPYPWVYPYGPYGEKRIHCDYIVKMSFGVGAYRVLMPANSISLPIIKKHSDYYVKSFMTAVKSFDNSLYKVKMKIKATTRDGKIFVFEGTNVVTSYDTMIFLNSITNNFVPIVNIIKLEISFDKPVIIWSDDNGIPFFSWLGVNEQNYRN
jgi:hypothetical protein